MTRLKKILNILCVVTTLLVVIGCFGCKSDKNKNSNMSVEYFVTINKTNVILEKGENIRLSASYGDNVTPVTFSSSDINVATVSKDGYVSAINAGICYITAKAGKDEKTCKVTVREVVYTAELIYNKTDYVLVGADLSIDFVAYKDSKRITYLPVTWTVNGTSDNFIVTDNDTIRLTPSSAGEYIVKATTDKCVAECKITVKNVLSD